MIFFSFIFFLKPQHTEQVKKNMRNLTIERTKSYKDAVKWLFYVATKDLIVVEKKKKRRKKKIESRNKKSVQKVNLIYLLSNANAEQVAQGARFIINENCGKDIDYILWSPDDQLWYNSFLQCILDTTKTGSIGGKAFKQFSMKLNSYNTKNKRTCCAHCAYRLAIFMLKRVHYLKMHTASPMDILLCEEQACIIFNVGTGTKKSAMHKKAHHLQHALANSNNIGSIFSYLEHCASLYTIKIQITHRKQERKVIYRYPKQGGAPLAFATRLLMKEPEIVLQKKFARQLSLLMIARLFNKSGNTLLDLDAAIFHNSGSIEICDAASGVLVYLNRIGDSKKEKPLITQGKLSARLGQGETRTTSSAHSTVKRKRPQEEMELHSLEYDYYNGEEEYYKMLSAESETSRLEREERIEKAYMEVSRKQKMKDLEEYEKFKNQSFGAQDENLIYDEDSD